MLTDYCLIVFLGGDYAVILVDSPSDDENILTKEAMDAIWELHSVVLGIEVSIHGYLI